MADNDSPDPFEQSLTPRSINELQAIFEEIQHNVIRREWLVQNEERIREAIQAGLEDESVQPHGLAALLLVLPHVRSHYEQWTSIILPAVKLSRQLRQAENVSRLYMALASFYSYTEQHEQAEAVLKKVEGWFSLEMREEVVAETGICLVEVLLYRFDKRLNDELLNSLLRCARAARNPHLLARAHQSLCRAYTARGDKEKAIVFGKRALDYFTGMCDRYNMFRSALALAKAYRASADYILSERYLQIARESVVDAITDKEWGDLYYELGVIGYERAVTGEGDSRYEDVIAYFQQARAYYDKTAMPYRYAAVYHAQGLLLTRMGSFDDAEECLKTAEDSWAKLENPYQMVNTHYARSFNEAKRGALTAARQLAHEAVEMVGELPDTMSYDELHGELQFHLRKLNSGYFPKAEGE